MTKTFFRHEIRRREQYQTETTLKKSNVNIEPDVKTRLKELVMIVIK